MATFLRRRPRQRKAECCRRPTDGAVWRVEMLDAARRDLVRCARHLPPVTVFNIRSHPLVRIGAALWTERRYWERRIDEAHAPDLLAELLQTRQRP